MQAVERHHRGWRRRQGTRVALEFFAVAAPVVCITAELRAADLDVDWSPIMNQVVMMASIQGSQITRDALRVAFTAEAPLAYLRAAGNGHAGQGFLKVACINGASMVLPLVCAAAYGGLYDALMDDALSKEQQTTLLALFALDTPVIHTLLLTLIGFPLYHFTNSGLHKQTGVKKSVPIAGDALSIKRRLMNATAFRLIDDVFLGELLRQSLLTFGPAVAVHYPLFSVAPVVLDQWLLTPLREYRLPTEGASVVSCRTTEAAFRYVARSSMVIAAMIGLNYLVLGYAADDNDPESIDQPWHIAYEVGLMAAALLLEQGLSLLPPFREPAGTWYRKMGLFSEKPAQALTLDDPERQLLIIN